MLTIIPVLQATIVRDDSLTISDDTVVAFRSDPTKVADKETFLEEQREQINKSLDRNSSTPLSESNKNTLS